MAMVPAHTLSMATVEITENPSKEYTLPLDVDMAVGRLACGETCGTQYTARGCQYSRNQCAHLEVHFWRDYDKVRVTLLRRQRQFPTGPSLSKGRTKMMIDQDEIRSNRCEPPTVSGAPSLCWGQRGLPPAFLPPQSCTTKCNGLRSATTDTTAWQTSPAHPCGNIAAEKIMYQSLQ